MSALLTCREQAITVVIGAFCPATVPMQSCTAHHPHQRKTAAEPVRGKMTIVLGVLVVYIVLDALFCDVVCFPGIGLHHAIPAASSNNQNRLSM